MEPMDIIEQEIISPIFKFPEHGNSKTTKKIQSELDTDCKLPFPTTPAPSTPHSAIMKSKFMLSSDDEHYDDNIIPKKLNKPELIKYASSESNKENKNHESNKKIKIRLPQIEKTPSPQIKPLKMTMPKPIKRGRGRPKGSKNKKKSKTKSKTSKRQNSRTKKNKKNKKQSRNDKNSNKLQLPPLILPKTNTDFKPKLSPYPRSASPSLQSIPPYPYQPPYHSHPYSQHPAPYYPPSYHPQYSYQHNYHYQYQAYHQYQPPQPQPLPFSVYDNRSYQQQNLLNYTRSPSIPLLIDHTNEASLEFNQYLPHTQLTSHQAIPPSVQSSVVEIENRSINCPLFLIMFVLSFFVFVLDIYLLYKGDKKTRTRTRKRE